MKFSFFLNNIYNTQHRIGAALQMSEKAYQQYAYLCSIIWMNNKRVYQATIEMITTFKSVLTHLQANTLWVTHLRLVGRSNSDESYWLLILHMHVIMLCMGMYNKSEYITLYLCIKRRFVHRQHQDVLVPYTTHVFLYKCIYAYSYYTHSNA